MKSPWAIENRVMFNEIPAEYDKARWEYPAALYADIFSYKAAGFGNTVQEKNTVRNNIPVPELKNAIEIGAGTGKATRPVLDAGYSVTAVELGDNMAEFLRSKYAGNEKLRVIVSSFEDAELAENNFDLIYAASAFHWVDASIGGPKAYRLLKPGGVFALFRSNAASVNELDEAFDGLYDKYYLSFYIGGKKRPYLNSQDLSSPEGIYRGYRFYDMAEYGFKDVQMKFHKVSITYSADDYLALMRTYSDHNKLPEENRRALHGGMRESIMKNGGSCKQDYLYQLYMGRKL